MIKLTDPNGLAILIAKEAIIEVREAGISSQWHRINACIRTIDNRILEVTETVATIERLIKEEL